MLTSDEAGERGDLRVLSGIPGAVIIKDRLEDRDVDLEGVAKPVVEESGIKPGELARGLVASAWWRLAARAIQWSLVRAPALPWSSSKPSREGSWSSEMSSQRRPSIVPIGTINRSLRACSVMWLRRTCRSTLARNDGPQLARRFMRVVRINPRRLPRDFARRSRISRSCLVSSPAPATTKSARRYRGRTSVLSWGSGEASRSPGSVGPPAYSRGRGMRTGK